MALHYDPHYERSQAKHFSAAGRGRVTVASRI